MVLPDSGWAHVVGVASLFAFAASAFVLAARFPDGEEMATSLPRKEEEKGRVL
jgi:hypothetical protein